MRRWLGRLLRGWADLLDDYAEKPSWPSRKGRTEVEEQQTEKGQRLVEGTELATPTPESTVPRFGVLPPE